MTEESFPKKTKKKGGRGEKRKSEKGELQVKVQ